MIKNTRLLKNELNRLKTETEEQKRLNKRLKVVLAHFYHVHKVNLSFFMKSRLPKVFYEVVVVRFLNLRLEFFELFFGIFIFFVIFELNIDSKRSELDFLKARTNYRNGINKKPRVNLEVLVCIFEIIGFRKCFQRTVFFRHLDISCFRKNMFIENIEINHN